MDKDKAHHSILWYISRKHGSGRKTFSPVHLVFGHCGHPALSIHPTTVIQVQGQVKPIVFQVIIQTGTPGLPMEPVLAHEYSPCSILSPQGFVLRHRDVMASFKMKPNKVPLHLACYCFFKDKSVLVPLPLAGSAWQRLVASTAACSTTTTSGIRFSFVFFSHFVLHDIFCVAHWHRRKHWFCSGGRMCLYLRDDPWLRKWGDSSQSIFSTHLTM